MVTGASDGIGLAYCKELALHGFNIIMVSRNQERLESAKRQVLSTGVTNVKVVIEVQDLSLISTYAEYLNRFDFIRNYDIAILINNAGLSFTGPFNYMSHTQCSDIVNVNCLHPTYLTKMIIPQLLKREQKSAIIAVSSLMGNFPGPNHITYCASKVYVDQMYDALEIEMRLNPETRDKIDIQNYKPGFVATKLSRQVEGFTIPNPTVVV